MKKYFNCKVSFEKTLENGQPKRISESYIVDALSFTEAEARIVKEIQPYVTGEFEIVSVNRCNIAEIIRGAGESWYRCKINCLVIDEARGIEKYAPIVLFIQSINFDEAYNKCKDYCNNSLNDLEIENVSLSKIIDIFEYGNNL